MQYIIMCGGDYPEWETPRQLIEINGEPIVARTIRLLKECGVDDIAISSNNEVFSKYAPVLKHDNRYTTTGYNKGNGLWCDCFYPTDEPTCYLFGDVVYSPEAIRTIVEYKTDDIMFFASRFPFNRLYPKWYVEPFAFKVTDTQHLKDAVAEVRRLNAEGKFHREPIAWEVWNVICETDPNTINGSYVTINDYTCDIDNESELMLFENILGII